MQMLEEVSAVLPKISMCAMEPEQLRQLCAGKKKRDAALEAGHHAFGNEIYNDTCFDEPGYERDERDKQRGSRSECAEARSISTRDLAKRCACKQRDRGRDGDDCVPRTAKKPKNESTKQTCVKPGLGWQIGQGCISQTGGKKICGKRDASENVAA